MDLDAVRAFKLAAEMGSFTQAAQELLVTQPAISQRIRMLESELGTPLFQRRGRYVQLLPSGESFLEFANKLEELLQEYEPYESRTSSTGDVLRVACGPVAARTMVPELFIALQESNPNIRCRVAVVSPREMERQLQAGTVDIGLIHPRRVIGEFDAVPVREVSSLVLVAPRDHPLSSLTHVRVADLGNHPFVATTTTTEARRLLTRWAREHDIRPNVVYEVDSHDAIAHAVGMGIGIGFVLETIASEHIAKGTVSQITIADDHSPLEGFSVAIAFKRSNRDSPLIQAVVRAARKR